MLGHGVGRGFSGLHHLARLGIKLREFSRNRIARRLDTGKYASVRSLRTSNFWSSIPLQTGDFLEIIDERRELNEPRVQACRGYNRHVLCGSL